MTRKILTAIIFSSLLILAGCKQDADNTKLAPYLYDYVPVNVGHTVTYDVDSIVYSYDASTPGANQIYDTVYYQLKDVVLDTFIFNNQVHYDMAEYKRYDTTQPFPPGYLAWYSLRTITTYETVKNDLHFVNFVFPPISGLNWQGNTYLPANDTIQDTYQIYAGWTYTYTSVNTSAMINNNHLDSTATVTAINTESTNAIQGTVSMETYARHIGLVYREFEVINKQDPTSSYMYPNQANGFRVLTWYHSYTP
jgi:hypothetical protein